MQLYGYWRSSAAYRVRIALYLKQLDFESKAVHLIKDGGQQHLNAYGELNPNHLVPTLVDGEVVLNQSLAIIDYLDAKYPQNALYPNSMVEKALVQAFSFDIACEIHPVNNLRVQQYLGNQLGHSEQEKLNWTQHWMQLGFSALEAKLNKTAGEFSFNDKVSVADICLVPQVYNANRFNIDMSAFPLITGIVERCNQLAAFQHALPENQPDAVVIAK
ncbi:maleylacetoacetate isomerase [Thalassotalea sp. PLHSN55]|uniref:maleylacetoacetate isomerase n=1 Tax=Thalassotalea sp. PLHSN55 TaxID=3435888 RepID=UPI003F82FB5F